MKLKKKIKCTTSKRINNSIILIKIEKINICIFLFFKQIKCKTPNTGGSVLNSQYEEERNAITILIPNFTNANMVKFHKGSAILRIVLGISCISILKSSKLAYIISAIISSFCLQIYVLAGKIHDYRFNQKACKMLFSCLF